ncbi:hypothetical protein EMCRGX_G001667 [Ephydatia muelleri]
MEHPPKVSSNATPQGGNVLVKRNRQKGIFILNLTLSRPEDGYKQDRELALEWIPETIADLQDKIQDQFNIPIFDQKLMFGPAVLSSKESIQSYSLRNGDSITVEYTSEADVKEISDMISYIQKTCAFLESLSPHLALTPISDSLDTLLQAEIDATKLEAFPSLYQASSPKRRTANCLLFVEMGGLRAVQQLHSLLLLQPWKKTTLQTQLLENSLNRILWTQVSSGADMVSETAAVSKEFTLDNIVRSFLRVTVVPNTAVTPPPNHNMERYQVQYPVMIVTELILNALGTLTCALEFDLRAEQLSIVVTSKFLEQVIGFLLCPSFPPIAQPMAMSVLVLLTYYKTAHNHLCKPSLINGLIRSWRNFEMMQNVTKTECTHFKYLADYKELRKWEDENGYSWKKFLPYLRMAYFPYHAKRSVQACGSDPLYRNFQMMCIETGIFSLQLMMSGEKERKIIEEQGLLDYIICLPSVLPKNSSAQKRAKDLVAMLGKEVHLQPPSLNTMARARLAVTYFGVERALKTPAQELLSEVYTSL